MTVIDSQNSKEVRWSAGGTFLEGLGARDFGRLATSLAPDVRMRALLPPGPMEWAGSEDVAETFRSWFGEASDFELIDAAVGEVGGRLHLSWRLRVRPAPFDIGALNRQHPLGVHPHRNPLAPSSMAAVIATVDRSRRSGDDAWQVGPRRAAPRVAA